MSGQATILALSDCARVIVGLQAPFGSCQLRKVEPSLVSKMLYRCP